MPEYVDFIFKSLTIVLVTIAIFQLIEVRRRRKVDTYWKIFEIYTSQDQINARKNTSILRGIIATKFNSNDDTTVALEFYSVEYHLTQIELQKSIDRSIISRIRFINTTGILLKMHLINKDMLFELIGIGFEHDYSTLNTVIETHRKDHEAPQMYNEFENVMSHYKKWKINRSK